jgi:Salmonella virulence plasmid 65kDa B protein
VRNERDASVVSGVLLLVCLCGSKVGADDTPSGVSPQVITLPKGPGSIQGLGESFKTQLNTGTFSYTVPIQTPPGRAGLAPDVRLTYSSSGGYGPLGLGWSIGGVYYVQRKTESGVPLYTDQDTMISGWNNEDLVWVGDDLYRCKNEGAFIRFRKVPFGGVGDFWWEALRVR